MKTKSAPKQFLNLFGDPIIVHTIRRFNQNPLIDKIIVVMLEEYIPLTKELVEKNNLSKVAKIVPGGDSGQMSIFNGIQAAVDLFGQDNTVLIHDGVRPYFEDNLIERCVNSVKEFGSAISCVPATETITQIDDSQSIQTIIDRNTCYLARAPQCFRLDDLYRWHKQAQAEQRNDIIDSCSMMLKYSDEQPHLVMTIPENIKVTTPIDYYIMRAILEAKDELLAPEIDLGEYK